MAKDTFYFTHDYNCRQDEKIKLLIRKLGNNGYGLFWMIVEDLYNNANALQTDYDGIAFDLRSDSETIKSIINDFDLFVLKDGMFGSLSVQRRLDERNIRSKKAQISANIRWENANALKNNANALPTQYDSNAIKERKGKEIKEIKEKKEIGTTHPLQKAIQEKLPTVSKLKTQLTEKDCERLVDEFDKNVIWEILEAMENKVDLLKKYSSVNLTIRSWIAIRREKELEKTPIGAEYTTNNQIKQG
jgi:transcriptional regulator of heat shock response